MRKLGVSINPDVWKTSEDEVLEVIRQAGFDAFFIGYLCRPDMEARMARCAEAAARKGLWFECVHAPFIDAAGQKSTNRLWLPGEAGDAECELLISCVRSCRKNGVGTVVVHLSAGDDAPCISDVGHSRLDRLVNEAVKENVTLAFENQRKLANLAFVFEVYNDVPQVRFCWDKGHEACFTPGREYMPLFGDKLVYTHIHDNNCELNRDLHMVPFDGSIDFARRAAWLKQFDYQGTLTLEVAPKKSGRYDGWNAPQFYAHAYAAACRLRDMVDGSAE